MQLRLPARQPFSLGEVLRSHGWARLAPFRAKDDMLSYVLRLGSGQVVELRIQPAPKGVAVDITDSLDELDSAAVARAVAWMLGLHVDLSAFYALVRAEPKLAHVEPRGLGRLLRSPSLWEDAVKTILTTNVSWGNTVRMVERLVDHFSEPLPEDPLRRAFPTPLRIALSDVDTLRDTARLGYRAPYVHALARSVSDGHLALETFTNPALPTEQVRRELLAIKGWGIMRRPAS